MPNPVKVVRWSESEHNHERVTIAIPADLLLANAGGGYNLTLRLPDARALGVELVDAGAEFTEPGIRFRLSPTSTRKAEECPLGECREGECPGPSMSDPGCGGCCRCRGCCIQVLLAEDEQAAIITKEDG